MRFQINYVIQPGAQPIQYSKASEEIRSALIGLPVELKGITLTPDYISLGLLVECNSREIHSIIEELLIRFPSAQLSVAFNQLPEESSMLISGAIPTGGPRHGH